MDFLTGEYEHSRASKQSMERGRMEFLHLLESECYTSIEVLRKLAQIEQTKHEEDLRITPALQWNTLTPCTLPPLPSFTLLLC